MNKDSENSRFSTVAMIVIGLGALLFISITLYRNSREPYQDPANVGSLKKMIQQEAEKKESEESSDKAEE